jgi:hypothetical protein
MEDFERDYFEEHFAKLPPEGRREILRSLPPEEQQELLESMSLEVRLAGLSAEQIRQYLERLTAGRPAEPHKKWRKG